MQVLLFTTSRQGQFANLSSLIAYLLLAIVQGCSCNQPGASAVLIRRHVSISTELTTITLSGLNGLHCVGFVEVDSEEPIDPDTIQLESADDNTVGLYRTVEGGTCGDSVAGYKHLATIDYVGTARILIACDQGSNLDRQIVLVVMKSPQQRVL